MRYIVIPLLLVLFSCGVRKVELNKESIKVKTDSVAVTVVDGTYVDKTNIQVEEKAEEIEYKPADSLKPMVINGKQYINTIIRIKRNNKKLLDTSKVESTLKINKKVNVKKDNKKDVKVKNTEKKPNYWMYLWFLIPVVIIMVLEKYGKRLFPFIR